MATLRDDQKCLLRGILQSWMSGIGEPFPKLFENDKILKELWDMTKDTQTESALKGAARIGRNIKDKIDPQRKKRGDKHNPFRTSDATKGITPREEGHGGPMRKIGESMEKCLLFIDSNINKEKEEIKKALETFEHKEELLDLVDHLIITNMGGWKVLDEDNYVHETGRTASPKNWILLENGHLATKNGKYRQLNLDKLYAFKE